MAAAAELCGQPFFHNRSGQTWTDNTLTHSENVGVIVLPGHLRRKNIMTQRCSNAFDFVGSYADANSGSTDENALAALASNYCTGHIASDVRVVH